MSSRSPFEIGQQIGENFAPSIERQKDYSAIDDIFAQVSEKGSPQDFDSLMAQIIQRVSPQNQAAAMGILNNKKTEFQRNRTADAYEKMGLPRETANLEPNIQREVVKSHQAEQKKQQTNKEELQYAFDRTSEILESGATGINPFALVPGKTKEARAEFDTLSEMFLANLIPLVNPRGVISKPRFDYIKSLVPQSSDTNAVVKGKLKALKQIFKLGKEAPALKGLPEEEGEIKETIQSGSNKLSLEEIFG